MRTREILKTLSNTYDGSFSTEPCVTMAYSELETYHCTKNHIFFFQMFGKDDLSKKVRLNMIFLVVLSRLEVVGFSHLSLGESFFAFSRISPPWSKTDETSLCIIWKNDFSFSQKYDLILLTENERWSFSRNTWKYDIFCIYV